MGKSTIRSWEVRINNWAIAYTVHVILMIMTNATVHTVSLKS